MSDDVDRAEHERLAAAREEPGGRKALATFYDRRAREEDEETATFVAAFGGDPEPGTVLAAKHQNEAEVLRRPAARSDVRSAFVTTPDGRLLDKDEVLARTHPAARPPR